jgi:hypothetical protein
MYLPYQPTKEIKKGNRGAVIPGTCFDQPYYHSKGVMWFHHRRQSRCCQSNKVSCNVWRSGARKEGWLQVNRTRDDGLGQLFPSEIVRQKVEVPGCDRQKIEIDKGKPRTKEIRVFTDEGTRGEMLLSKGKPGMLKSGHVGQVFRIGWPPPNFPDPYMLCASNHCQMGMNR